MKNLPITLMLIASFGLAGFSNTTAPDRIARPVMVQTNVMEESASAEIPAALPTKEPYSVEWVYDGENIDGKHNYKIKLDYIHLFSDKDNEKIINKRVYEHYKDGLRNYLSRAEDDFSMFSLDTAVSEFDGVLFVTALSHMQLDYISPANVTSVMYDISKKEIMSAEDCLEKFGYSYDNVLSRVNGYYADREYISAASITGVYVDDKDSLIAVVQLTVSGDDDVVFPALFDIAGNVEVGSFMNLKSLAPAPKTLIPSTNLDGLSVYPSTNEAIYPGKDECAAFAFGDDEVMVFLNGSVMPAGCTRVSGGVVSVSRKFAEDELKLPRADGDIRHDDYIPLDELAEAVEFDFTYYTGAEEECMIPEMPQIMISAYPKNAMQMSEDEALERLKNQLITAYEAAYGRFEPLYEEPEVYSDEVSLRYLITNCKFKAENDRFYIARFVWDFYIDRYTGEIFTRYNGLDKTFTRFNPLRKGALAFPG